MMNKITLLFMLLLVFACSDTSTTKEGQTTAQKVNNVKPDIEKKGVANAPDKIEEDAIKIQLDKLQLPEGFKVEVYAEKVKNARSMTLTPNGTLFVGTMRKGNVYAIVDEDGDKKGETIYTIAKGLNMPNGVAFKDGSLFVAEVNRILRFDDIEKKLDKPGKPVVVYDKYPTESHHGWKYIAFGPDDKLYVPVGAPCNICKSDEIYASITRMNADGSDMEVVQHGVRNTVGFNWHPDNNELWFTDNGRDWMGDDLPACELNHAPQDGMHFGYPYCHQGDVADPEFGSERACTEFTPPAQKLGAHVAPLGIEFYTGQQFPEQYSKQIFIAEHGSWNRSKKSGYQIVLITLDENKKVSGYKPFIKGWMDPEKDSVWGRPVDIEWMPDGSMLISDDYANAIYRVSYEG